MTQPTLIRAAGDYTVTYEHPYLLCNGQRTSMAYLDTPRAHGDRTIVAIVDTGTHAKVGLTAEEAALIRCAARAASEAELVEYRRTHAAEIAAWNAQERLADAYDRNVNEGGEGYNPYRPSDLGPAAGYRDTQDE